MKKILFVIIGFWIILTRAFADDPDLSLEQEWKLQEIPLLKGPVSIKEFYSQHPESTQNHCIGGPFQDQGSWFFCKEIIKEDNEWINAPYDWVGFEGCEDEEKVYYIQLKNEIPLAGLRNCQLLTAANVSIDNQTADFLHLLNKQGNEIWRYQKKVDLKALIPDGGATSIFHDMTILHRDLGIDYQDGYLFWDGQRLNYINQDHQLIWQASEDDLLLEKNPEIHIIVNEERLQPRLLLDGQGQVYLSFFKATRDEYGFAIHSDLSFVIHKIIPGKKLVEQIFQRKVTEVDKEDSTVTSYLHYEPIILLGGELAVLWMESGSSLGLLKYDAQKQRWNKIWEDRRSTYQGIFFSLTSPLGHFILIDDSISITKVLYEEREEEEPFEVVLNEMDYAIRIIKLDEEGSVEKSVHVPLEDGVTTTESTIWPIGYLIYLPNKGIQIMMNEAPHYSREWQKFHLKIVD